MTEIKSTNAQLQEVIKFAEAAAAQVVELKKLTREEDLKTVISLISLHGFTATDLKSVIKTRGANSRSAPSVKRAYNRKKK